MSVAVLIALTVTAGLPAPAGAAVVKEGCAKPPAIAHRGGTEKYPENTREAFRWAADTAKAAWWETDVQFDSAGIPFILHDTTLDRTTNFTGDVAVHNLSDDRANGLRIDGGYLLPSLYEFLKDLAARPGEQAQVELKTVPTSDQLSKVLARLDWTGTRDQVVITSFDPAALDMVNAVTDPPRTGLISELGDQDPAVILPHARIYSKHNWAVTWDRLQRWLAAGLTVTTWTVDDPAVWKRMAQYGPGAIAGIVTNHPSAYGAAVVC